MVVFLGRLKAGHTFTATWTNGVTVTEVVADSSDIVETVQVDLTDVTTVTFTPNANAVSTGTLDKFGVLVTTDPVA